MKITTIVANPGATPVIGSSDFPLGIVHFPNVLAAGTSFATAQPFPNVGGQAFKIIAFVFRQDDSNYAVSIMSFGVIGPTELDIFAIGPNGKSITVFTGPQLQFNDGSTSIAIDCGRSRKFTTTSPSGTAFVNTLSYSE